MYFNFDVIDKGSFKFVSSDSFTFEETPDETRYYLKCEDFPQYFHLVSHLEDLPDSPPETTTNSSDSYWIADLWEGWWGFPKYKFNEDKYHKGQDPFEPFNVYEQDYTKHWIRRREIAKRISLEYGFEHELKRLRKIIYFLLQGKKPPKKVVDEFMEYNNKIESIIAKHPKEKTYWDKIDPKKYNGIKDENT